MKQNQKSKKEEADNLKKNARNSSSGSSSDYKSSGGDVSYCSTGKDQKKDGQETMMIQFLNNTQQRAASNNDDNQQFSRRYNDQHPSYGQQQRQQNLQNQYQPQPMIQMIPGPRTNYASHPIGQGPAYPQDATAFQSMGFHQQQQYHHLQPSQARHQQNRQVVSDSAGEPAAHNAAKTPQEPHKYFLTDQERLLPLQPIERIMKEALGCKHHSEKNRATSNQQRNNTANNRLTPADLSLTAGLLMDQDLSPSMAFEEKKVTKIAKSGSHTVQEFLTEFILFVTSEAHSKAQASSRETIQGSDILNALQELGFDNYYHCVQRYSQKYKEVCKLEKNYEDDFNPNYDLNQEERGDGEDDIQNNKNNNQNNEHTD